MYFNFDTINTIIHGLWGKIKFDLILSPLSAVCRDPKVEAKSYTTSDALLSTETAYIIEVKVPCDEVSIM